MSNRVREDVFYHGRDGLLAEDVVIANAAVLPEAEHRPRRVIRRQVNQPIALAAPSQERLGRGRDGPLEGQQ